jgi:hypothetical protein
MYEPERGSKLYILLIAAVASLLGWSFFVFYKPMIIEASCSEIAATSSNLLFKNREKYTGEFSFYNVKSDCVLQSDER